MLDELRELYQEVILDHGKNPRNFRDVEDATSQAHGSNPLCDQLVVYVKVGDDDIIQDVSFVGKGCAISMASASMMTELVRGKTIDGANHMFDHVHHMCTGEGEDVDVTEFGEDADRIGVLSGVREFPVRVKCATLAWHTLKAAMEGKEEASSEA